MFLIVLVAVLIFVFHFGFWFWVSHLCLFFNPVKTHLEERAFRARTEQTEALRASEDSRAVKAGLIIGSVYILNCHLKKKNPSLTAHIHQLVGETYRIDN